MNRNTKLAFNLQRFATSTNGTGTSSLSAEMKTYYDKELLQMAGPNLVHAQFAVKKPIPKNGGKTIELRKFSNFAKATTPLTEGVTPDGVGITVTNLTKSVDQYGNWARISDMLELSAIDNVIVETTDKFGQNAGETLDTIVRNELITGTNVIYAPNGSTAVTDRDDLTAGCKLTAAVVAQAATFLKKQNAPKIDGYYIAIIHPSVAYDLRQDTSWVEAHKYASPEEIYNGEIGKLHGVRFIESTEAKVWQVGSSGSEVAVYGCIFLGKDAYATVDIASGGTEIIVKSKGSAGTEDPLDQRSSIGWKSIFAAKIIIPEYIVRVECGSSFSAIDEAN